MRDVMKRAVEEPAPSSEDLDVLQHKVSMYDRFALNLPVLAVSLSVRVWWGTAHPVL